MNKLNKIPSFVKDNMKEENRFVSYLRQFDICLYQECESSCDSFDSKGGVYIYCPKHLDIEIKGEVKDIKERLVKLKE